MTLVEAANTAMHWTVSTPLPSKLPPQLSQTRPTLGDNVSQWLSHEGRYH